MGNITNVGLDEDVHNLLEDCKELYLEHHPEMKKTRLSKNKIVYEVCKFYLEK